MLAPRALNTTKNPIQLIYLPFLIVRKLSSTAYTKRFVSSIRRDQKPDKFSSNGSGLPIPTKGSLLVSSISLLIRLSVFLS